MSFYSISSQQIIGTTTLLISHTPLSWRCFSVPGRTPAPPWGRWSGPGGRRVVCPWCRSGSWLPPVPAPDERSGPPSPETTNKQTSISMDILHSELSALDADLAHGFLQFQLQMGDTVLLLQKLHTTKIFRIDFCVSIKWTFYIFFIFENFIDNKLSFWLSMIIVAMILWRTLDISLSVITWSFFLWNTYYENLDFFPLFYSIEIFFYKPGYLNGCVPLDMSAIDSPTSLHVGHVIVTKVKTRKRLSARTVQIWDPEIC